MNNKLNIKISLPFFVIISSILTGLGFTFVFYNQKVFGLGFSIFYIFIVFIILIGKFIKFKRVILNKIDILFILLFFESTIPAITQNGPLNALSIFITMIGFYWISLYSIWGEKLKDFSNLYNIQLWVEHLLAQTRGLKELNLKPKTSINSEYNFRTLYSVLLKVFAGIIIALPFLCIFFILFISADTVFQKTISNINLTNLIKFDWVFYSIILTIVISLITFFNFVGFFLYENKIRNTARKIISGTLDPLILLTFSILINVLFLFFIITQFIYLFGDRKITVDLGIVYSDYARRGFMEMLFISILSSLIILGIKTLINEYKGKVKQLLNFSLIINSIFNFIILISAFKRLDLYVNGYGLTQLRFFVYAIISFFIILFIFFIIAIIIDIFRDRSKTIYKKSTLYYTSLFTSLLSIVMIFILALINPDYTIAKINIDRQFDTQSSNVYKEALDIPYLINLSSDSYYPLLNDNRLNLTKENLCNLAYNWVNENHVRNNISTFNLYKFLNQTNVATKLLKYINNDKLSDECNQYIYNINNMDSVPSYLSKTYIPQTYLPQSPEPLTFNKYDLPPVSYPDNSFYTYNNNDYPVYPYGIKEANISSDGYIYENITSKLFDSESNYPNIAVKAEKNVTLNIKFNNPTKVTGINVSVAGESTGNNKSYLWTISNSNGIIIDNYETNVTNKLAKIDFYNECININCISDTLTIKVVRNNGDRIVHIMEIDPIII